MAVMILASPVCFTIWKFASMKDENTVVYCEHCGEALLPSSTEAAETVTTSQLLHLQISTKAISAFRWYEYDSDSSI